MRSLRSLIYFVAASCLFVAGCGSMGGSTSASKFPGTKDGARALLSEFMKPGADTKKLTAELRPTKEDYRAFYLEESQADRAEKFFEPLWSGGQAVVAPKEGQTELKLYSATPKEMEDMSGETSEMPPSLLALGSSLKPDVTVYTFKFVAPGESAGMAFEGLTYVNGKWKLFPKPWRFMSPN